MRLGRPARAATAVVACALAAAGRGLVAQVAATLDLGVSNVRYDGFLPSAAASISPAFRLERHWALASARGTYLHFESGRHSLQGNLGASLFTRLKGRFSGELSGAAGASRYADFASFSHLLLGPRVHLTGAREGSWVGGTAGTTSFSDTRQPVTALTLGAWAERLHASWLVSGSVTRVGDTSYTDIEGATHFRRGRITLDGSLGIRSWSRGGGHGVYGEASSTISLGAWLAVVISGGRYPTDPTRGTVSGRYAGLAMRLTALPGRSLPPVHEPRPMPERQLHSLADASDFAAVTMEVRPWRCAGRILFVHAADVTSVEVSGDFTDWEPVALSPGEPTTWIIELPIVAGTYRFNIRLNGGEWIVPAGVTLLTDEFGGKVGLLTIP